MLDTFPQDSACWLEVHSNGGGDCDYEATMPVFTPDEILADENGVVYLFSAENGAVYRWSSDTGAYINPLYVGSSTGLTTTLPSLIAYSEAHSRLYFGYSTGDITFIDLDGSPVERQFTTIAMSVDGLSAVGNYVLAQDNSGAWESHYVFDYSGFQTDYQDWNQYSRVYAWNEQLSRVYFFRDTQSPNDLMFEDIDQATGIISAEGETPYHGSYSIRPPIVVSDDGEYVLLGSGDLYDAVSLEWAGSVGDFDYAVWSTDNELLTAHQSGNSFVLNRRSEAYVLQESVTFSGTALGLLKTGDRIVIVSRVNGELVFAEFTPNDDSDGDGVDNLVDAFPLDASASLDSDNDGYPDSWNDGYTDLDSTTGLELDSFPEDSACWSEEHATSAGACDYQATMPVFTPDEILTDVNGVVYLFSAENGTVYRWSSVTGAYINPLYVGSSDGLTTTLPSLMAYSEVHSRLYFGYNTGEITFIDLGGSPAEQHFAMTAMAVRGLASVGNYVLAQDGSGAWAAHYIFDLYGVQTEYLDWNYYSRVYAWNEQLSRVYFFRDTQSPNDLMFEEIDQATGLISAEGETPYHGDYSIRPPISVVNNGQHVVLGSGDIYQADSLTHVISMQQSVFDVAAFDEVMVTARQAPDKWLLDLYLYSDWSITASFEYSSEVMRTLALEDELIVVLKHGSRLEFEVMNLGDSDEDGIPAWWEVKYGLSDQDGTDIYFDLDLDGVNNLDEYLVGSDPTQEDSDNDGLNDYDELNTYSTSPIDSDSDDDGLSDDDEVNTYGTDPNLTDSDGDGFDDKVELDLYGTDPADGESIPESLGSFTESFESGVVPAGWISIESSDANWLVDVSEASAGSGSIRSGIISNSQHSSVVFSGLFPAGTFYFDAKVEAESCCDKLKVYVDGVQLLTISAADWSSQSISLDAGEHSIEWRYYKDGSVSIGRDAAWIDNVRFE